MGGELIVFAKMLVVSIINSKIEDCCNSICV